MASINNAAFSASSLAQPHEGRKRAMPPIVGYAAATGLSVALWSLIIAGVRVLIA